MAALGCVLLLIGGASCSLEGEDVPVLAPAEGEVQIEFKLPGEVADQGIATRSGTLPTGMTPHPLPEGTTVWMSILQKDGSGQWVSGKPKAYRILATDAGVNSLHACGYNEVTENGENLLRIDPSIITTPLYLKPGEYKFRMIAPAIDLRVTDLKARIDNGMYFYATDDRYEETKAEEFTVAAPSGNEIQYINLKPMIQQVARLQFTLYKGNNVNDLEILPAGIEVSGIQNTDELKPYNWGSESLADTLVMKMGDKRGLVKITEFQTSTVEVDGAEKDCIIGHTGVLPTDAVNNSISVLLNLRVNGVPTQYMTLLNTQKLFAAYTYNYRMAIGLEDGVVVVTWQNQSWGTDVTLN